jgi:outer membrane protein insertion porin family
MSASAARSHSLFRLGLTAALGCLFLLPSAIPAADLPAVAGQNPPQQSEQVAVPQAPRIIIERIDIVGNRRVPRDTLRARMFLREGDVYNVDAIRRDYMALWNTQYFEDIRVEEEDVSDKPNARIIVFYVTERPVVRRIEYCKLQEQDSAPAGGECKKYEGIPESDILERFKERKVGLSIESQFDPTRVKRAEVILKELLGERGRQFAVVIPTYERLPGTNAIKLVFNIDEGPKVKVGKIRIDGNQVFSDGKVIRQMRHSRPVAIPLWITYLPLWSKTFHRGKLNEDLEIGIRGLYQDHGYFRALVKDPILDTVDINRGGIPGPWPLIGRKRGKRTNITIPVEEGDLYHMGRLVIRPADPEKALFFKTEFLQSLFPLKQGDIFAVDKIRKAMEDYKKLYGEFGFIDFTPNSDVDIDAENKVINLILDFDEQKQFFVRRIEFVGNTTTRDKVIRREILIDEGDLYNNRYWELSLLRLNQLDYFEEVKQEHAEIKRNLREGTVDIQLKLQEKGKQSVGLTGGISGLAGNFIGLNYTTNNFLGLGETLSFDVQFGDRQRYFMFSFTEPYFRDRPISTGFTIFSSRFSFDQARETSILVGQAVQLDRNTTQNFNQNSNGFTLFASYPLRRFSFVRVGASYSFSHSNITAFSEASRLLFENLQFRSFAGPSALRGIRSSRFTPTITYNTVNSVFNPTRGTSFFVSTAIEGGPLQGNVNTLTNVVEFKNFRPVNRGRNVLGFRLMAAFATGYSGLNLPPNTRFYIGGEDSVRGFDIRTISPVGFVPVEQTAQILFQNPTQLDSNGNPRTQLLSVPVLLNSITFPGGDLQGVGNVEYRIPLVGPVSMALFFDYGLNGTLRRNQLRLDPAGIEQLRSKFPDATIPDLLALSSGSNFKPRSSTGIEFVVQLPVVNAPFRLYWAYNWQRFNSTIQPPRGSFQLGEELRSSLPPGVFEAQVAPQINSFLDTSSRRLNFFEPLKTIRFTVSRTF